MGIGIAILGTLMIGWWVGEEIKASIINESAAATALYLDSFITPHLQELSQSASLPPQDAAVLDTLLDKTELGRQIVALKVWDKNGKILYSNNPALIGSTFPETEELALAWQGRVIAAISDLREAENAEERRFYDHLLEIHVPIRLNGTHQVIAIAEFYQRPDAIEAEIALAQRQSWLAGMRERVESLGGRFLIESNRGSGTKITALLPLTSLLEEESAAAPFRRRVIVSESQVTESV